MGRALRILLVKPRPRLATIRGLAAFQLLEPLELGYLAAVVGPPHQVRVLDLRLSRRADSAFRATLAGFRPDLVGFTGYTHEASTVRRLAQATRTVLPRCRVVVGGHHATVLPQDFDVPQVDYVVRGWGCEPFRNLVDALARGDDHATIPSVLRTGDANGAAGTRDAFLIVQPTALLDPARVPIPRRDLWNHRAYTSTWLCARPADWQPIYEPVAMVRSSFGCRMRCTFCVVPHLYGGHHLPRPVDDVVEEIAGLEARHVYFGDDESFIDPDASHELARALAARGVRKRYFAWVRSTTVLRAPDLLRRWREIGLDAVFVGFEFPTDEELRQVHKGASVAINRRAHDALLEMGIAVHAAFMVRPEYTREQFERLAEYVRGMPAAECSFTVCTPSPGTPDYAAMEPRIWVRDAYDLHDGMHPLVPTALPLREFTARFARQVADGDRQNPLRTTHRKVPPRDLLRVLLATARYRRSYGRLYRDYPRGLWDSGGAQRAVA